MLVKVNKVEKTCICGFGLIYLWSGSEGIVMLTPIPILLKIKSYFFYKFVESVFSAFNLMFRIKINYEWSLTLLLDVGYGLRPAAVQIWHWITGKILYIVKDIVKCLQYIVECLYLYKNKKKYSPTITLTVFTTTQVLYNLLKTLPSWQTSM